MVDIFNPSVSQLVGGLDGKLVLIYGANRTGKTYNSVKAKKPLVIGFEKGLNAIPGIPFIPVSKWGDWTATVTQLTGPMADKAHEMYHTIIIDTFDAMGSLASECICNRFGCDTIGSGNRGYGLWKEYSDEISKWVRMLTNSGFTVIFIGHDGTRELQDEQGNKYEQIYPRGDKRVVPLLCDLCDIIAYAHPQPLNEKGEVVNSTLFLKGNRAFHAGSRFTELVPYITEWDMSKLEAAISEAIAAMEQKTGVKAVSFEENHKMLTEAAKSKWADKTFEEVKALALEKGGKMVEADGNPTAYQEMLFTELANRSFSVTAATERQRDEVERILDALIAKGY